jgi:hypothetical protein
MTKINPKHLANALISDAMKKYNLDKWEAMSMIVSNPIYFFNKFFWVAMVIYDYNAIYAGI